MGQNVRRYLVLIATILATQVALADDRPAEKSGKPKASSKVPVATFELCDACSSQARRRVAVLPVHVGVLPDDAGLSGKNVASTVREKLEALVSAQAGLYAIPNSDFGLVTSKGPQAPGAASASYRQLPAQAILVVTVDPVEVRTDDKHEAPSSVAALMQKAQEADREAAQADEQADAALSNADDGSSAYMGGEIASATCAIILAAPCSTPQCFGDKNARYQSCVEDANRRAEQARDSARQEGQYRAQREAGEYRSRSQSLRAQAQQYRQQAQTEEQQGMLTRRTTTGRATVQWSSVDTTSGATLASGTTNGSASDRSVMKASEADGTGAPSSVSSKVILEAVDEAVRQAVGECTKSLTEAPFRAKVVSTEGGAIVINAGSVVGVSVGDTFGVRSSARVLTDPDTGKPLEAEPAPVGKFRVTEVRPKAAVVQPLERRSVKRGDELVWIGVFTEGGKAIAQE